MDDTFQFIIESPQHNQGHKKRPRLVTSCDNCRLKKIKCLQPTPEAKCEACKASKIPCRFRDRERYFAERSRAIAGPSVNSGYSDEQRLHRSDNSATLDAFSVASGSSSPSMSHIATRSTSHSPKASGLVGPEGEANGRYQSYPPDPRHVPTRHAGSSSISSYHHSRSDSLGYAYIPPSSTPPLHNSRPSPQQSSRPLPLFDVEHPQFPYGSLMQHYAQLFFEHYGSEFPFLSYEDTLKEVWDRTLPAALANCIAALGSRFSTLPELTMRGLHNVAETYVDNAKTILSSITHIPTMDTLHALMLVSWSEYKNNKITGFRAYYQMAMRMAMDLGLSDQNAIQVHLGERERNRRRLTWSNILQLHAAASSSSYSR